MAKDMITATEHLLIATEHMESAATNLASMSPYWSSSVKELNPKMSFLLINLANVLRHGQPFAQTTANELREMADFIEKNVTN